MPHFVSSLCPHCPLRLPCPRPQDLGQRRLILGRGRSSALTPSAKLSASTSSSAGDAMARQHRRDGRQPSGHQEFQNGDFTGQHSSRSTHTEAAAPSQPTATATASASPSASHFRARPQAASAREPAGSTDRPAAPHDRIHLVGRKSYSMKAITPPTQGDRTSIRNTASTSTDRYITHPARLDDGVERPHQVARRGQLVSKSARGSRPSSVHDGGSLPRPEPRRGDAENLAKMESTSSATDRPRLRRPRSADPALGYPDGRQRARISLIPSPDAARHLGREPSAFLVCSFPRRPFSMRRYRRKSHVALTCDFV